MEDLIKIKIIRRNKNAESDFDQALADNQITEPTMGM